MKKIILKDRLPDKKPIETRLSKLEADISYLRNYVNDIRAKDEDDEDDDKCKDVPAKVKAVIESVYCPSCGYGVIDDVGDENDESGSHSIVLTCDDSNAIVLTCDKRKTQNAIVITSTK